LVGERHQHVEAVDVGRVGPRLQQVPAVLGEDGGEHPSEAVAHPHARPGVEFIPPQLVDHAASSFASATIVATCARSESSTCSNWGEVALNSITPCCTRPSFMAPIAEALNPPPTMRPS